MTVDSQVILSATQSIPLLHFYHSVLPPLKRAYSEHKHTAFEISCILSGSGLYKTQNALYHFHAGDIFLYSTNEIHYIIEIFDNCDILNLHFEPRFIWSPGNDLFDSKYLNIFFNHGDSFENCLEQDEDTARIRQLLLEIEKEFNEKLPDYELMVKVKVLTILVTLGRNFNFSIPQKALSQSRSQHLLQLDKALAYIDDNISSDIDLNTIAKTAHMSRSYFSTIFKEMNGLTPWEYIINKRGELAAHYLTSTDFSILDIACKCGFNNTANFNHAFKKVTRKSPSDFRKSGGN